MSEKRTKYKTNKTATEAKKHILTQREKQVFYPKIIPEKELSQLFEILEDVAKRVDHGHAHYEIMNTINTLLKRAKNIEAGEVKEDGKIPPCPVVEALADVAF